MDLLDRHGKAVHLDNVYVAPPNAHAYADAWAGIACDVPNGGLNANGRDRILAMHNRSAFSGRNVPGACGLTLPPKLCVHPHSYLCLVALLKSIQPSSMIPMRRKARMKIAVTSLVAFLSLIGVDNAMAADESVGNCRIGIYRLRDGGEIDIAPGADTHLRWRRKDGTSGELTEAANGLWSSTLGWTSRPDGIRVSFSECAKGEINFAGVSGRRIPLAVTETQFQSGNARLAGRLLMPRGSERVPIVVLVHGSEDSSALNFFALQRMFPTEGIGVFVYDKRGTGISGGNYSHDFALLAQDAVAAMREAKRLAGLRASRVGYQGTSQGGWVAPLAATMDPVDFVIVGYGLAVSPLEEDRAAIVLDITRHGFGADVVAKAMEIADASATVIASNFKAGYDQVDAVRAKYEGEPWFKYVHGNFTFAVLQMPHDELREKGPKLLPDIQPHYDPMPVLRKLKTSQLWILGEDDLDAPSAETARRLKILAREGQPITTAMFPRAEHGIFEYETSPDGTRLSTRNADGYFSMMRDFILSGRLR
ncbi:MAG TPA: alpha/beta hydrolase, partial [Steroidobacteraceae bacterium]|nr:alpha/beta hydrolase [Steroidobacteraceae bacterium]